MGFEEDDGYGPRNLAWRKYEWFGPLVSFFYTLYVLVKDGLLLVSVIAIAHGVEYILDLIERGSAPIIFDYTVRASTIVRFGDYSLLLGFVVIQGSKLLGRLWRDDT